jgi:hypothetical protein
MKRFLENIQSEIGDKVVQQKSGKKKSISNQSIDINVRPLLYNGHVITTHKELKDLIKIDSFEEVVHGHIRRLREKENETNVPEVDRDPANRIDPKFF